MSELSAQSPSKSHLFFRIVIANFTFPGFENGIISVVKIYRTYPQAF